MVLASPGLLLALLPMWRDFIRRLPLLVGTFLLGVVPPYAWMVGRWLQEPEFSFPGTLRSPDDVVAHVSRRAYSEVDTSVSAGWFDKLEFLQWLGADFVWQLTLPGFLLALVGLAVLIGRPPRTGRASVHGGGALEWAGRWAGPAIFVGQSVLLLWLLNFDFDFFHVQVFRAYPLVCYGLLAIWVAMGSAAHGVLGPTPHAVAGLPPPSSAARTGRRSRLGDGGLLHSRSLGGQQPRRLQLRATLCGHGVRGLAAGRRAHDHRRRDYAAAGLLPLRGAAAP